MTTFNLFGRRSQQRYNKAEDMPPQYLRNFQGPIRAIGEAVLNGKKDIRFHRNAETKEGAKKYADKHKLLFRDEDINGDGIPDMVVYKKDGTPVMINGWEAVPSQYPYRLAYKENYENDPEGRIRTGGYSGFMKKLRRGQERKANLDKVNAEWKDKGYKLKGSIDPERERVSNENNTYKRFFKLFSDIFNSMIPGFFGPYQWMSRVVPQLQIANILYIRIFVINAWTVNNPTMNELRRRILEFTNIPEERCKIFRKKVLGRKEMKEVLNVLFTSNIDNLNRDIATHLPDLLMAIGFNEAKERYSDYIDSIMLTKSEDPDEELEKKVVRLHVKEIFTREATRIRKQVIDDIFRQAPYYHQPEGPPPPPPPAPPAPQPARFPGRRATAEPRIEEPPDEEDPQGW